MATATQLSLAREELAALGVGPPAKPSGGGGVLGGVMYSDAGGAFRLGGSAPVSGGTAVPSAFNTVNITFWPTEQLAVSIIHILYTGSRNGSCKRSATIYHFSSRTKAALHRVIMKRKTE